MSILTGEDLLSRLPRHAPQCSGQAHQQTHQLAWPRLWLSMMGLMMVVVAIVILIGSFISHSPRGSRQAHQRTYQLAWLRVWSSMMRLMMVASRSKICQKVEELSKSPKASRVWKNCKGHWFKGTFTEAPFLYQQRSQASIEALIVFRALLLSLKALSRPLLLQLLTRHS